MALPKITLPKFNITIPSTKKKTTFVPFTVREEKILLIAQESKDLEHVVTAIEQIITNCVQDVDVNKLATFDVEYLLINLRAKSVNDIINFKIRDPDTKEEVKLELNLNDVTVTYNPEHTNLIDLGEGLKMKMNYPKIHQITKLNENVSEEELLNIMLECIDTLVQGDEVFNLKDFTEKEVDEFINSLSSIHVAKIKKFFETMPKIRYEKEYKLIDGTKKKFVIEGTETFFI